MDHTIEYSTSMDIGDVCWTAQSQRGEPIPQFTGNSDILFKGLEEILEISDSNDAEKPFVCSAIGNTFQSGRNYAERNDAQGNDNTLDLCQQVNINLISEEYTRSYYGSSQDNIETACLSKALPNSANYRQEDARTSLDKERQRRASHNRDESKRRNYLNSGIDKLGTLLPKSETRRSRGCIVNDAVGYIKELKSKLVGLKKMEIEMRKLEDKNRELLQKLHSSYSDIQFNTHSKEMAKTQTEQEHGHVHSVVMPSFPTHNVVGPFSIETVKMESQQPQILNDMIPPQVLAPKPLRGSSPMIESKPRTAQEYQCNHSILQPEWANLNNNMEITTQQQTSYTDPMRQTSVEHFLNESVVNPMSSLSVVQQSHRGNEDLANSLADFDQTDLIATYLQDSTVDKSEFNKYLLG